MQHLNVNGTLNELAIPNLSRDLLDEVIATLLMACVARVYPHVLTGSFAPNLRFLQQLLRAALRISLAAGLRYPFTGWLLSFMIAALAMSLNSASVIGNALRLRGAVIREK
ncbi:MAG: hypothetical protein Q8M80_15700 [Hydrogenophaga sp.]|nr:hypothetical protein [Hydrogenophaga sp.]MDP3810848.1 hypothetical protein [Hydrogenophaga sp.]